MARFSGKIGFMESGALVAGVWSDTIVERDYSGEYLNETASFVESEKVNDDIHLSERISIVADPSEFGTIRNIKYVVDEGGVFWSVSSVQVKRPRLILSTGGVYHGPKPQPSP